MSQSTHLTFKSDAFPVIPGEDEETNPGIFGQSLAEWLMGKLQERDVAAEEVIPEDFAWCVSVSCPPYRGYVACGVALDSEADWLVFAFVEGGLRSRLFGKDRSPDCLDALYQSVRSCLEESGEIRELREQPYDV